MQYWTENHQIGWKGGMYLIGQGFAANDQLKDFIFEASNSIGEDKRQMGKIFVKQWLDYRAR